jgi:RHS repeat-associated protein
VSKIVNGGAPVVWSIFRDNLGSITHVKNGATIQEYSFDAYGRRRDKDDWSYTLSGEPTLFADRGYTGHEHLTQFGLINMNGRLFDPVVGRFLSPDNYVQAPSFTQSFNRYGYCMNNPLRYTDPDGEWFFSLILPGVGTYIDVILWSATIDWAAQTIANYASNPDGKFSDWAWNDVDWLDVGVSGAAGGLTMGLGNLYEAGKITKTAFQVGKAINTFAIPAISSRFDFSPNDGFEVNSGSDFWNSYLLDVAVTGISAKTGNEIVDGLFGDKPWILNDPLKGGLWKKFLELPLMVGSEYLEDRSFPQKLPNPDDQPEIPVIRPAPYRAINFNGLHNQNNKIDLSKNLILNRF